MPSGACVAIRPSTPHAIKWPAMPWPKDEAAPADEPANPGAFARSAQDATGRGMRFKSHYEVVERAFGVVRAAISVRYTK
jgi:hypothetical protein